MSALLLEKNDLRLAVAAATSAGTAVNGAVMDLAGFDGGAVFATIATANAGNFLKLQAGNASDGSDMADVAGSKAVAAANGSVVCVEFDRIPGYRYARGVIIRAGANTATGDMFNVRHNASVQPTTKQVTNSLVTVTLQSPALGTP